MKKLMEIILWMVGLFLNLVIILILFLTYVTEYNVSICDTNNSPDKNINLYFKLSVNRIDLLYWHKVELF